MPKKIPVKQSGPRASKNGGKKPSALIEKYADDARLIARDKGVAAAVDFLCSIASRCSRDEGVKILLGAAQMVDSTDPVRASNILESVLEMDPQNASASLGLSVVRSNLGDSKGSVEALKAAIEKKLEEPQKLLASLMLTKFGLLGEALTMCKGAFGKMGSPLGHASSALDIALQAADWDFTEELIEILRGAHLSGNFREAREAAKTNILWCDDEVSNVLVASEWARSTYPDIHLKRMPEREPLEGRRVRIGYLSSDFRVHPTAFLINGLFRNHDKGQFELFLYCSGWDDGSEIRKQVLSHFDHTHQVSHLSDQEASNLIESHRIDILVELNGATKSNRLGILAHRPAPVQICYLGWPGSVGGRFVDYIVADDYILPEQRAKIYPEKIIWLNGTYQINDYAALPPLRAVSKREYGFAEDDLVVGMFNTINKVRREVWTAWMEILRACPNAKLWVLDPGPDVRENLAKETTRAGIDLDRVIMGPKLKFQEHLARMQICDLVLDPWPIGGHTSAADALHAKVPLISMEGSTYASRVGGSLLRAAGLEALVQSDRDTYIGFAIELLKNPLELKKIKKIVTHTISTQPIFDARERTHELEAIYRELAKESIAKTIQSKSHEDAKPAFVERGERYNICVVSPPNYPFSAAFDELAQQLFYGLRELGHYCTIRKNQFIARATNIVLGGHLMSREMCKKLPDRTIVFNTEQLGGAPKGWEKQVVELAQHTPIWDYSLKNIEYLKAQGARKLSHFRFGYQRQLDRIIKKPEPKYDLLFYGCMTERRRKMIKDLNDAGVYPHIVTNCFGKARDDYISDSRFVLNIHAYESKIFESVRVSYLLNNGVPVLTEWAGTDNWESSMINSAWKASEDSLVSMVLSALQDCDQAINSALNSKRRYMATPQSALLETLLDEYDENI